MTIRVELYGIPRQRAGTELMCVTAGPEGIRLRDIFAELTRQSPGLAEACFDQGDLRIEYLASIDGETFITDSQVMVLPGQSLLLFSADAGG